jgi:hypothetical protein
MKKFYLTIGVFASLFIGCSSTYKVSDFSSREKFYDDFNKSVKDKIVKVTLDNDSTFNCKESTNIANDSLYFSTQTGDKRNDILPLNKVKSISCKNHLLGVPVSLVSGTVIGTVIGLLLVNTFNITNNGGGNSRYNLGWGITSLGLVAGGIFGWFNGYTYTYQFNP